MVKNFKSNGCHNKESTVRGEESHSHGCGNRLLIPPMYNPSGYLLTIAIILLFPGLVALLNMWEDYGMRIAGLTMVGLCAVLCLAACVHIIWVCTRKNTEIDEWREQYGELLVARQRRSSTNAHRFIQQICPQQNKIKQDQTTFVNTEKI